MYDVIVVGARCAGSPLAMLLARKGHRVLVVDRATFPSDTISTHYIQQSGLSLLKSWGLLDRLVATGVPPIRRLNFSYAGIELGGFADPVDGITEVYAPRRTVLDKILVDAAREAGAEVIEDFTVEELVFDEHGRATGIRGRSGDDSGLTEFRGSFVVGADGRNSKVAELVNADFYDVVPAACFIYYSYFSGVEWGFYHQTDTQHQQIGTWPTNDGMVMCAVMQRRDRFREFRTNAEENFHAVYDAIVPELGQRLRDSGKREEQLRPMLYPDNYRRRSSGPGWALVGDAGYHRDPFTGLGITDAMKYGQLLAERLHEGLSGQRPIDEAVAEYVKLRDEDSQGSYAMTCSISTLELTPYFDAVFRATSMSEGFKRRFFNMLAGGIHGDEFFAVDQLQKLYDEVDFPVEKRILSPR
ncbi:NAD(P)/FAD-dependent oxidoreductase [Saccharopolyspora indica]|uniref:NAD(P)/FAD-dependent oxidoreductase n=1 Tax=Saccharopolyspora indica TaxID=1229659 RepID=UPI0022EA4832|nr:NAD(P)/FAD-dependent oxidoreductase [Saccharopolyspora indica]MDA3648385.1 NAD(P)/FAD-dependent oxidoreductase [Saccharopolyspora indica]